MFTEQCAARNNLSGGMEVQVVGSMLGWGDLESIFEVVILLGCQF